MSCVSSPGSVTIGKSNPSQSGASCSLREGVVPDRTLPTHPCKPPLGRCPHSTTVQHVAANPSPVWPQPCLGDWSHHSSARSCACPRQEVGWLQPCSTAAHPSPTQQSSGSDLPPTHTRRFNGTAGVEQPPSQQKGVDGGLFKGTRQFTWPVPAMLIDVHEEHNFSPVHLLPFISSTWEPSPCRSNSCISVSSAWLHS